MKKVFLLAITSGLAISSFAQNATRHFTGAKHTIGTSVNLPSNSLMRTTAVGDVDTLKHIHAGDTLTIYYNAATFDSGFIAGMNAYEDQAFAERFDFDPQDSTLQVLGMVYYFSGTVNPASTKTLDFKVWSEGPRAAIDASRPGIKYSGMPNTSLASRTLNFTQLGIGNANPDTPKLMMFATPTAYLSDSFFVGVQMNYTWATANGDTIAIVTNQDGERVESSIYYSGTDTIVNNVGVTKYSDGTWHDNEQENFGVSNNMVFFPVVKVGIGLVGVNNGISRNGLTFFGNYPNPATNSTNIKYALAAGTDVTITVMDINGRVLNTISQPGMAAGEHVYTLETSNLAAGNYVYLVRTATGAGMASQLTIVK